MAAAVLSLGWSWGGAVRGKLKEGNVHYRDGDYPVALKSYLDAQLDDPELDITHYNIGTALFKQDAFQEALGELMAALETEDIDLQQKAYYNLGNGYFRLGEYQSALEAYTRALRADPEDMDAKHNLEVTLARLAQQQQLAKERQDQEGEEGEEQQEDQQQSGGAEQQGEQEEEQQPAGQDSTESSQDEGEEEQQPTLPDSLQQHQMSEEEARRLLDSLSDEEKEQLKELQKRRSEGRGRGGKDW